MPENHNSTQGLLSEQSAPRLTEDQELKRIVANVAKKLTYDDEEEKEVCSN